MEMYGMTGERLGTIGHVENKKHPEWQQALTSRPSISRRKGYAANYDQPYEDASVLVLTARSGKFVDIRFPIDFANDENGNRRPLSSFKSFWAFSGVITTTFYASTSKKGSREGTITLPYTSHEVFRHQIDSRGPGIVDEGDMFLLPNGDAMEVGLDTDPVTGITKMYKEYWTGPIELVGSENSVARGGSAVRKTPCLVAETVGEGPGRGIMIRIGDYCQGVYEPETGAGHIDIVVVRKEQVMIVGGTSDGPTWITDPRSDIAQDRMPFDWLLKQNTKADFDERTITTYGDEWHIVEADW